MVIVGDLNSIEMNGPMPAVWRISVAVGREASDAAAVSRSACITERTRLGCDCGSCAGCCKQPFVGGIKSIIESGGSRPSAEYRTGTIRLIAEAEIWILDRKSQELFAVETIC